MKVFKYINTSTVIGAGQSSVIHFLLFMPGASSWNSFSAFSLLRFVEGGGLWLYISLKTIFLQFIEMKNTLLGSFNCSVCR